MKTIKLTPKEAAGYFRVSTQTLREWDKTGKIKTERTVGGDRRYLIVIEDIKQIVYCRVSSPKQKDDLQRQISFMQELYPNSEIISDVGSGINFKRKGLKTILEYAIRGDSINLIVAHKDRLARFGFDLIAWIIERAGGSVVVLGEQKLSPTEELTQDLLTILHVFSCRMHGLRNYAKQINSDFSNQRAKEDI